tara:strand:+ start:596 stop:844 length:249 start_codon:yes stop_codon:yes gene_type:complete
LQKEILLDTETNGILESKNIEMPYAPREHRTDKIEETLPQEAQCTLAFKRAGLGVVERLLGGDLLDATETTGELTLATGCIL